jgi:putative phosphoribosyl transferase
MLKTMEAADNSMKFRDRVDAGNALADRLVSGNYANPIVLGVPRGGVILADIVARRLGADFDIVIPRKLGAPDNEELAIGAVTEDGTAYTNTYIVNALRIPQEYVEREKEKQAAEIRRRMAAYRRPAGYNIAGRQAILVDDGIATGATVIASARWVKKQKPASVTIAVPVAPPQSVQMLEQEANSVIVIMSPRDFSSVGQFYEKFEPVSDEQVAQVMRSRNLL